MTSWRDPRRWTSLVEALDCFEFQFALIIRLVLLALLVCLQGCTTTSTAMGQSNQSGSQVNHVELPLQTVETKWDSGQLKSKETYYLGPKGEKLMHGTCTEWYPNGQKRLEIEYRQGKANGSHTIWHENGQKEMQGQWVENRETGMWTWWYSTGEKSSECTYEDGKIVGKKIYWSPRAEKVSSGKISREDVFNSKGELVEMTRWYDNGQKWIHGTFRKGEKHRHWTYWRPDGQVKAEGVWQYGKPWEGVCGVPSPGSAGNYIGFESFAHYSKGKLIEKVHMD